MIIIFFWGGEGGSIPSTPLTNVRRHVDIISQKINCDSAPVKSYIHEH